MSATPTEPKKPATPTMPKKPATLTEAAMPATSTEPKKPATPAVLLATTSLLPETPTNLPAMATTTKAHVRKIKKGYDSKRLRPLPPPPDRHPSVHWKNHANPNEAVDLDVLYPVKRLLGRRGRPPKLAYLVEWDCRPHQFTWVWPKDLESVSDMMCRIDEWKAAKATGGTSLTAVQVQSESYSGATASSTERCFLEAFQAALYFLGRADQVTIKMWEDFSATHSRDLTHGAKKADQVEFYRYLRDKGVLFDFNAITPNRIGVSVATPLCFKKAVDQLQPGWYVVHAAQDDTEH